jgi:hypothetical protein
LLVITSETLKACNIEALDDYRVGDDAELDDGLAGYR